MDCVLCEFFSLKIFFMEFKKSKKVQTNLVPLILSQFTRFDVWSFKLSGPVSLFSDGI